jgi:hypothetical protein
MKIEPISLKLLGMSGISDKPSIHAFQVTFMSYLYVEDTIDLIYAVHEVLVRDDTYQYG